MHEQKQIYNLELMHLKIGESNIEYVISQIFSSYMYGICPLNETDK